MIRKCLFILILSSFFCPIGQAQTNAPHPDNSVESAIFVKMGIPPLENEWTPDEFETALTLLRKIRNLDKYSLPRYKSKYSSKVFDKLVARNNFNYLINQNFDLGSRLAQLEKYAIIPSSFLALYSEANAPAERFGSEVLSFILLNATLSNNAILLLNELEAELGPQARTEDFLVAKSKVQEAHNEAVATLLEIVIEQSSRFNNKSLFNYFENLIIFIPETYPQLNKSGQERIAALAREVYKNHSFKNIRKNSRQLFKLLRKTKGSK